MQSDIYTELSCDGSLLVVQRFDSCEMNIKMGNGGHLDESVASLIHKRSPSLRGQPSQLRKKVS